MEIRVITKENQADLNLKNEAFSMPGRVIPKLEDGVWNYRTEFFETPRSMTFPDEDYDYELISSKGFILGAYVDETCIGVAIFQEAFLKYMYLYDLKVCAASRGSGAGKALIQTGLEAAKERGYKGIYTQVQDNNLNAFLFYLRIGFRIGGFDNRVYSGTSQADKADILLYLDGDV